MCPGLHIDWLSAINFLLSTSLLVLNGVYAIWGLAIKFRSDQSRDNLKEYMDKLELYLNIVTYTDSVLVPLKLMIIIIIKKCCCPNMVIHRDKDESEGFDAENPRSNIGEKKSNAYTITRSFQKGSVSTFQVND